MGRVSHPASVLFWNLQGRQMLVGRLGEVVWSFRANLHGQPLPFLTAATDEDEEGKLPEDIMKVNPFA